MINRVLCAFVLSSVCTATQAMSVWVVESGQDPFSNSGSVLQLSSGITKLDLYYDVEGDTSYGYDLRLSIVGDGSISNVGGGDSGLGNVFGSGWRQLGGSIFGEMGSSVLGFSFDFSGEFGTQLIVDGLFTNANFLDQSVAQTQLAVVSPVPVPAPAMLLASGLLALIFRTRRSNR